MTILVDSLKRGVVVHGRARNRYALCRVSTDERDQRGLQHLHDWMQDVENTFSGWDLMTGRDKPHVSYWFEVVDGVPLYHLSGPKREWALRCGAVEVSDADLTARCAWIGLENKP